MQQYSLRPVIAVYCVKLVYLPFKNYILSTKSKYISAFQFYHSLVSIGLFPIQTWPWMRWENLSALSRRLPTRRSGCFLRRSPSVRRPCPPVLLPALPVPPPPPCALMRLSPSLSPRTDPAKSLLRKPWPSLTLSPVASPRALTRAHYPFQTTSSQPHRHLPTLILLRWMSSRGTSGCLPLCLALLIPLTLLS